MRKLGGAAVVIATTVIAACLTLNVSETAQPVDLMGPPALNDLGSASFEYNFSSQGNMGSASFAFLPGGDDYYVDGYSGTGACNLFPISAMYPPLNGSAGSTEVYHDPSGTCLQSGGCNLRGSFTPGDCAYYFTVQFNPQPGSSQCTYYFHYTTKVGATTGQIQLTLDGSGSAGGIGASPNMLSFTTPTGTTSGSGSAHVYNMGTAIQMGSAYFQPNVGAYALSPGSGWQLNFMGSSATYYVTCGSAGSGTFNSSLVFQAATGSQASVPLTCTVQDAGGLTFPSGSPVNFPPTVVGTPSVQQMLTANFTGGSTSISFALDGSASGAGVTLGMPSSLTIGGGVPNVSIALDWTPTASVSGKLGSVVVSLGTGASFSVTINGTADIINVATNPTSIDFGAICGGNPVTPKSLQVYNTGGIDATLHMVVQPPPPFSTTPPYSDAMLQHNHGNNQPLNVNVAPQGPGELTGSATLQISNQPDVNIPVHATVVGTGVTTTPGALAFGTTIVGNTSNRQQFALSNCGAGDLTILRGSITGSDNMPSNDFHIAAPDPIDNTVVPMTKSQSIAMEMTPQSSGHKMGALTLMLSDGTMQTISLDGSGAGPGTIGSGGTKDRETYYACSTGRPLALAPAGLAVWLLARRRRRK